MDNFEIELVKRATKIKATKDIIKQGKKYSFLIIVMGLTKHKTIIKNPRTIWNEPKDPGSYENSILVMDTTFA